MNRRGNMIVMVTFVLILFVILFLGFIMVTGSAIINWTFDIALPEVSNLGMVGDTNMTDVASYTFVPLHSMIEQLTWLTGVLYMMALFGSIGFAIVSRTTASRWLIGFYFLLIIVLVLGAILISSMYQDFYIGTDELAIRLQEHVLLSWMILYSPAVFVVMAFITGIILFSGMQQEEFV